MPPPWLAFRFDMLFDGVRDGDRKPLPGEPGLSGGSTPPEASQRIFIGQPVAITDEYAVLRLAMGAELLLQAHGNRYDPKEDSAAVRKLRWLLRTLNRQRARDALRTADAICFDVDASVVRHEGINKLACQNGCGEEVATMTREAMSAITMKTAPRMAEAGKSRICTGPTT